MIKDQAAGGSYFTISRLSPSQQLPGLEHANDVPSIIDDGKNRVLPTRGLAIIRRHKRVADPARGLRDARVGADTDPFAPRNQQIVQIAQLPPHERRVEPPYAHRARQCIAHAHPSARRLVTGLQHVHAAQIPRLPWHGEDVGHGYRELAHRGRLVKRGPDGAARMVPREHGRHARMQLLRHDDGERVAQRQRHGRGGSGCRDAEGKGFGLVDGCRQEDRAGASADELAVGGLCVCREHDRRQGRVDVGEQREELRGLAGECDEEQGVVCPDLAQVAMQRLRGVKERRVQAEAVEGRDKLLPDVARLTDARDDKLAFLAALSYDGVHGGVEALGGRRIGLVQLGQAPQSSGLGIEDVDGARDSPSRGGASFFDIGGCS